MKILGLNYFYHDSSACLVEDGELTIAIEEERLTREKHTWQYPYNAIARCMKERELEPGDIDAVALSVQPNLDWGKKVAYGLKHVRRAKTFFRREIHDYRRTGSLTGWMRSTWPDERSRPEIHFVEHHASHAAGTFFVSPYETAAILSVDGSGEWASSMLGHGKGTEVTTFSTSYFPMSLGSVYESVTQFCGFRPCYDEGKTMGLAPLGDPAVFRDTVSKIITVTPEGRINVDLSYFDYQFWGPNQCSRKFFSTFGPPRRHGEPIAQHHMDTAAAFQVALEDACLAMVRILEERTRERYLIIAGGVALNSVMNGRVLRESNFEDIYVMPAAGDNGTSIGAAYYVHHAVHGNSRSFVHTSPYVGPEYDEAAIRKVIEESKLPAERHDDIEAVTAKCLRDGDIVGWFQGKMEIGPRALGNRSILADPTLPHMKDKINAEVKHREAFRPFAPSAAVECKDEYFDLRVEAPFMLKVCNVLPDKQKELPAITHVDGTARLQTVREELNPRYHLLLSEFGKLSGVPVLLNTSFNVMGEPIVESPVDAIRCFYTTGIDVLVLGNHLIRKNPAATRPQVERESEAVTGAA